MSEPLIETSIVGLSQDDHDAWLPLWAGYQAFYETEIAAETTRATWARLLDHNEPVWGAIAWRGQTAVGLVHWIFHRSTWTRGRLLLPAGSVRRHHGSGARCRAKPHRACLRPSRTGRSGPSLLADSRDQRAGHALVRPGGGEERLRSIPEAALPLRRRAGRRPTCSSVSRAFQPAVLRRVFFGAGAGASSFSLLSSSSSS